MPELTVSQVQPNDYAAALKLLYCRGWEDRQPQDSATTDNSETGFGIGTAETWAEYQSGLRHQFQATLHGLRQGLPLLLIGAQRIHDLAVPQYPPDPAWVAVGCAQLLPGRVAIVTPTVILPDEPETTHLVVLDALLLELERRNIEMVQAMLSPLDPANSWLPQSRLQRLTDIEYLSVDCARFRGTMQLMPQFPTPQLSPVAFPPLHFQPVGKDDQRLRQVLAASHQHTKDCPQLNGIRDVGEMIHGYAETGASSDRHWFLVQLPAVEQQVSAAPDVNIGCLLLTTHQQPNQPSASCDWELVYFGLMPQARGSGYGRYVVEFAAGYAAHHSARRLLLAVDAANDPAIRIYSRLGFVAWQRQAVWYVALR